MTFCPLFLVDSIKALVTLDCPALWDTMLSIDGTHLEGVLQALEQARKSEVKKVATVILFGHLSENTHGHFFTSTLKQRPTTVVGIV